VTSSRLISHLSVFVYQVKVALHAKQKVIPERKDRALVPIQCFISSGGFGDRPKVVEARKDSKSASHQSGADSKAYSGAEDSEITDSEAYPAEARAEDRTSECLEVTADGTS